MIDVEASLDVLVRSGNTHAEHLDAGVRAVQPHARSRSEQAPT